MKAHITLPLGIASLVAKQPLSVLLETRRFDSANHHSYVFLNPLRTIEAHTLEDVTHCFQQIQDATAAGLFVAGYIAYEAGYALQGISGVRIPMETPLLWFGVYTEPSIFNHVNGVLSGAPLPAQLSEAPVDSTPLFGEPIKLRLSAEEHAIKVRLIQEHIASGATYQINFTDRVDLATTSSTATIYETLAQQQPVSYAAFLNSGATQILSFSPELFFRVDGRKIVTRPMKGTWPRGRDAAEDVLAAIELQNDEKNRSEHLMIVDLLRNDLGRLCETGSVRVEDIFSVERYPSLLQMTSTVSGTLSSDASWIKIFQSLFPSGSITGAPKLSSMQVIRDLEASPRSVYTGAIGYIAPKDDACFNVAIRTLQQHDGRLSMGVGGGIVTDSNAAEEYAECELKTAFLKSTKPVELIETLRWDTGYARLQMHIERLGHSSDYFGFAFSPELIKARLDEAASTFEPLTQQRVRLTLNRHGEVSITTTRLQSPTKLCRVRLSPTPTFSGDLYLRHKTTHRELYDAEWLAAQQHGFDDLLYFNERGELTEGAISNIFVRIRGTLCTPALSCGVLPGVFRRHLLETLASAEERILTLEDLLAAEQVLLCNSVRGLRQVTELQTVLSALRSAP